MDHVNWRELMAWPLSPQDRPVVHRLHQKYVAGEDLRPEQVQQIDAIWRTARSRVRDEAAESRLKPTPTVDHLFAELDKVPPHK
jgi:hypothetical protein